MSFTLKFERFLLNEQREHLGKQLGDVLSAMQALNDDAKNLSNRQLFRAAKGISNQIRRILKDDWSDTEKKMLQSLQRIGVAFLKGIDSNEDLREILAVAIEDLESAANDLEMPTNDLASPEQIS